MTTNLKTTALLYAAGESYKQPSIIVDIANIPDLVAVTKTEFGDSYPTLFGGFSEQRIRGDFSSENIEWRFSQSGDRTSNAMVLAGEKVVIHVATLGHGIGYAYSSSNGIVFSKTKIRITLFDVLNGTEESVLFDSFSKPLYDPSRYFVWDVAPTSLDNLAIRTSSKICGLFILEVSDESSFYGRADWTLPLYEDGICFPGNSASMQVAAYDWRDSTGLVVVNPSENVYMVAGAEFRTASISPSTTETEVEVFDDKTVFPNFAYPTWSDDEQKTTVLRDNAMVLLSTQGPILTADAPRAPLMGMGRVGQTLPATVISSTVSRPAAMQASEPLVERSSLLGKPVATNVFDDVRGLVSNHAQGGFVFFDPVRVLAVNLDASASEDLDSGMGWMLSGVASTGMICSGSASTQMEIVVGDDGFMLDFDAEYSSSSSSSSGYGNWVGSMVDGPRSVGTGLPIGVPWIDAFLNANYKFYLNNIGDHNSDNGKLYGYIFHYGPDTNVWGCNSVIEVFKDPAYAQPLMLTFVETGDPTHDPMMLDFFLPEPYADGGSVLSRLDYPVESYWVEFTIQGTR